MNNNLELYKSIIEDAVDAIFIGDEKGELELVNKSAELLTGYNKSELLSKNIAELFPSNILKNKPLNYSGLNENKTITSERDILKKDGSIVQVEMRSKKLSNGKYQSFMRDISERKKIEQEVIELNERYKKLFDFSPVGIVIEDKDGNIIDANRELHKIFGYDPETNSLIGKNISIVAHPKAKNDAKKNIEKILKGENLHHSVKSITKNGTEIYNDLHETKITLSGLKEGILSISKDITKQQIAENKLKENELRFRTIIEHSTNLFYTHDSTNKITYISPQAKKFLDCEPEEAMVDWTTFITENPINKIGIEKTKLAFETGIAQGPYELELLTKKGRKLVVEVNESPIVINGVTNLLVGAITNITDRKTKEEELEKSHKRFKELFEYSPIPILEEDVTELFNFFDQLKKAGISDLNRYFDENPSKLNECVTKITPLRINRAGLDIYGFNDLEDYINNFSSIFTPKSLTIFKEQLNAFFSGSSIFSSETETITRSGIHKFVFMKVQLLPSTRLGRIIALFSLIDITESKINNALLRKSANDLETLFRLSQDLIQKTNTDKIIKAIPRYVVDASISADSSSLWKFNESKKLFEVVSFHGYGKREIKNFTLPVTGTVIGDIYRLQKPIICNNTKTDTRYRKFINSSDISTKATIGVPLISENIVQYILFADNFSDTDVFSNDDVKLLTSFANISSITINNSKLYDKVKESELRYRSIVDSVGESIFIHDIKTGKILDVNKEMLKTYGYNYDEALELGPEETSSGIYPYTSDKAFEYVQKASLEGPQLFEWHAKRRNGELFWTEVNLSKTKVGEHHRIVAVVRDITERKTIENAMRESEAKVATIMRSAPVGIGLINNRILEYVNNNLLKLLGYEKHEMIGKSSKLFYATTDDFDKMGELYKKLQTSEIATGEARVKRKDNKIVDVIIGLSPIDSSNLEKGVIFSVLDITENKRTQEKFLLERARYKNLFEQSPIPLWEEDFTLIFNRMNELRQSGVTDFEKYLDENPEEIFHFIEMPKIIDVNEATLKLHKAKNKEQLYNGLKNVFSENSLPTFKNELLAIFNGDKYFSSIGEVKTFDGEIKYIDLRLYLEYELSDNKNTYKALLATLDITEQKKAEDALIKSEFNLKEAQRIALIGHWELDLITNGLSWSDEVFRIFNLTPQSFGATYEAFLNNIHPDDRDFVNKEFLKSVENKSPYNIVHRLKLNNSDIKYVREIGRTFYDDSDKPIKSLGTVQDITEIVLVEQKMNEELKRNQLILNTTNDGFILADDKGNIINVNPAYSKLVGYSQEELKLMNIRELEITIPKDKVDERIQRMLTHGHDNFETKHLAKDGRKIDLAVSIAITQFEDQVFVAAFVRDITLQNKALRELQQSKKDISELAQYLQNVREEERHNIATEIHDDLGQSLTALKLDASILLNKLSKSDSVITDKIKSMKDLTDQTIKTVQKISSELRPGILDDLGLAAAIEWETNKFKERTKIKCKLKIVPDDISLGDKLNITVFRLFQESCTNVARHSKATELNIKIEKKEKHLIMEIIDNGIGISEAQINNPKSYGIMGMRERLKNFDGKLNFTNKNNNGTAVHIVIPIKH